MRDKQAISRARAMRKEPTKAEKLLWERLRAHRLNGLSFRRQADVGSFVVDFLCNEFKLVIEIDGPVHDDEEQMDFDNHRARIIEESGFLIIRVKERVVRDGIDQVADWILRVANLRRESQLVPEALRTMDTAPLP